MLGGMMGPMVADAAVTAPVGFVGDQRGQLAFVSELTDQGGIWELLSIRSATGGPARQHETDKKQCEQMSSETHRTSIIDPN